MHNMLPQLTARLHNSSIIIRIRIPKRRTTILRSNSVPCITRASSRCALERNGANRLIYIRGPREFQIAIADADVHIIRRAVRHHIIRRRDISSTTDIEGVAVAAAARSVIAVCTGWSRARSSARGEDGGIVIWIRVSERGRATRCGDGVASVTGTFFRSALEVYAADSRIQALGGL